MVLEIGFGDGARLAADMRANPQDAFLGVEPYVNGMANFLKILHEDPDIPRRVRVVMADGLSLVHRLAPSCLDAVYILNPDPWPKVRHHKRRVVQAGSLDAFARVLKVGGVLIMTTDVTDLAEWMADKATTHPLFTGGARHKPEDWIPTRYEEKGKAAGRTQTYLSFTRCYTNPHWK